MKQSWEQQLATQNMHNVIDLDWVGLFSHFCHKSNTEPEQRMCTQQMRQYILGLWRWTVVDVILRYLSLYTADKTHHWPCGLICKSPEAPPPHTVAWCLGPSATVTVTFSVILIVLLVLWNKPINQDVLISASDGTFELVHTVYSPDTVDVLGLGYSQDVYDKEGKNMPC